MILVLGGAGYIGSHMVRHLCDKGFQVGVIDNLQTGHVEALDPRAAFYQGDIRDRDFLDQVFQKQSIQAIIHFAANSLVGESMENPLKYYNNNVYGTQVLLEKMREHHIQKIVFSSTAAVYGEPKRVPILETDATEPTNAYGETKLAMEKMFKWADKAHGIKYVSLRYFNVAGAHPSGEIGEDHHPETHLIPIILQVPLEQRKHITIFGQDYPTEDGTCIRDYIHVMDLAEAHELALNYLNQGNPSDVFNLGNGKGFSVKQMIESARQVTGHSIPEQASDPRPGDPAQLIASAEKAERILGWTPKYTQVQTIIQTAWQWHQNHPTGY